MTPGKYTIKELFNNRSIDCLLVPEIQRDYVWGEGQVVGLLSSIKEEFNLYNENAIVLPIEHKDDQLSNAFKTFYKRQIHAVNIGFVYAYNDAQYSGKYFLIDGQQRLTTCYLLLLALATLSKKTSNFRKIYFKDGVTKLDYKVRESAHDFFCNFVEFTSSNKPIEDVIYQNWYFDDYKNDITINSIYKNYLLIIRSLNGIDTDSFYDFVQDYVEFWYFDTNLSEQGEELYIYMNARGEQMQSNENLKAELLSKLNTQEKKDSYGREWEQWQDYFWDNKGDNENADAGFNEFLNVIAGFENYQLREDKIRLSKEDLDKGINSSTLLQFLNIDRIREYFVAFKEIFLVLEDVSKYYSYHSWIEVFRKDCWELLNTEKTNWFADLGDPNRGLEHSKMVFLWSLIYYFMKWDGDVQKAIRMLRLYFLRWHNYDRQITRITQRVIHYIELEDAFDENPFLSTEDESRKHAFLNSFKNITEQRSYEEVVWEIEDHPLNLIGKNLEAVNISHLVDFECKPNLDYLLKVKDKFNQLFPSWPVHQQNKSLMTVLLYYGEYWQRVSPWYYFNYKCDQWERIIRDMDAKEEKHFQNFFNDFLKYDILDILDKKQKEFFTRYQTSINQAVDILPEMPLKDQLIIYSVLLPDIWEKGGYIAVENEVSKPRLFINELRIIFNTKGTFKGGSNYTDLWKNCQSKYGKKANIINLVKKEYL